MVNIRNSSFRGTGDAIQLNPGQSCEKKFSASIDALDPRLGAVLPPGDYELFVTFHIAGARSDDSFEITCPGAPVRLTG